MATILVVEREPQVRELLLHQLRHLGHVALDGGEAGEAPAAGHDYELVVLEPVSDDARLFAQLLGSVRPDIPFVFVSIEDPTPETRALRPGDHLVKPVLMRKLGLAVQNALSPARQDRA